MTKRRMFTRLSAMVGVLAVEGVIGGWAAASAAPTRPALHSARSVEALNGDGIGRARFGKTPSTSIHRLQLVLRQRPTNAYYRVNVCGVDHASRWPGLIAFFHQGRFVGYTYAAHKSSAGGPVLATAKGFRVGDTLATGHTLYGRALHTTLAQGGAWSVATASGKIDGFLSNAPPVGSRSTVRTIEAGEVGCSAMTP